MPSLADASMGLDVPDGPGLGSNVWVTPKAEARFDDAIVRSDLTHHVIIERLLSWLAGQHEGVQLPVLGRT